MNFIVPEVLTAAKIEEKMVSSPFFAQAHENKKDTTNTDACT